MEKIKDYRVGKKGHRGMTISVPPVWSRDNGVEAGTVLSFYRGKVDGKDALILVKED